MPNNARHPIEATHRGAFTLIEVLIVVVIMAVLSGVVITSFFDTASDAKKSVLVHSLYTLRAQIGVYGTRHGGEYPELEDGDLPQLYRATDQWGEVGAASAKYRYGPYVDEIPINPFNESADVVAVATPYETPTAPADNSSGWQYDEAAGNIWPNNAEYFESDTSLSSLESGAVASPMNP